MISKKIYIILFVCICLVFQIGCASQTNNSKKPNETQEVKEEELLYGKYPEPILIAIGENNDIKKDYKKLTKDDLNKIRDLTIEKRHGFEENKEYDFSIILEMPNLRWLRIDLGGIKIRLKDYSILSKLNNLEELDISNVSDFDIKYISCLNSLTNLSISYSNITNLDFLENLPNIKIFSLNSIENIKNYEALKYLKNIEILNLSNLNISEKELFTIPDMPTLTGISFSENKLTNINSFPNLKNLESLVIESNPLNSISIPSNNVPKINWLNLSNCSISDADKINGMDTLEEIIIKNTKIAIIAPLKKFKKMKVINATLENIKDKETFLNTGVSVLSE